MGTFLWSPVDDSQLLDTRVGSSKKGLGCREQAERDLLQEALKAVRLEGTTWSVNEQTGAQDTKESTISEHFSQKFHFSHFPMICLLFQEL